MPPLPGLFSEAELHARLAEAQGALPSDTIETLREAWLDSRVAFRAKFFEVIAKDRRIAAVGPLLLYRAIGDLLPEGLAEGAAVWWICQSAAPRIEGSLARAGFTGPPPEAADALFDALIASKSAVVFAVDDWEESFARVRTPNGRIQLAIPELYDELDGLVSETEATSADYPFVLSAGERRSFTANTIFRNPDWRRKDRDGALRMHPDDAQRVGVQEGGRVRLSTRRGTVDVFVEISDRMLPGHMSLPTGFGLDFPDANGMRVATGVAPNDLTRAEDRDWIAGTPWHKHTPARVEAL
jgi:anaerobic selenocysteine-containing dehydrogenase